MIIPLGGIRKLNYGRVAFLGLRRLLGRVIEGAVVSMGNIGGILDRQETFAGQDMAKVFVLLT